jgi:hypothetical protein
MDTKDTKNSIWIRMDKMLCLNKTNLVNENSNVEVPSAELVKKLRPIFAGVSGKSLFDKHLLIWSHNDMLQTAFISEVPDALSYRDDIYYLQQPYIGDWNALLNSKEELVGFSLFCNENEPIITSDFLRRHSQIKFENGFLTILFHSAESFEEFCVAGIGTRVFMDSKENYMFLFPKWLEWSGLEIPDAVGEIPVPI